MLKRYVVAWCLLPLVLSAAGVSYRIESAPHGELYVPESADRMTPKVLAIHGGGWRAQDRSSFRGVAEALAARGAIVYNVDYRLTTEAPWPACGDDCLAAAEWLSAWRTNDFTETIFTVGGSSGGHLSLMTGGIIRRPGRCGMKSSFSGCGDILAGLGQLRL